MNFTQKKDHYKTLGIPSDATPEEIKKAYRDLSKENHPDTNDSDGRLQSELNEAYETLSDPIKRKQYDEDTPEARIIKQADEMILSIFKELVKSTFDKNTLFSNAQLKIDDSFNIDDSAIGALKDKIKFLKEVENEKVNESTTHLKKALDQEIKTLGIMIDRLLMQKAVKFKAVEILQRDYRKEKRPEAPTGYLSYKRDDPYQHVDWSKFQ